MHKITRELKPVEWADEAKTCAIVYLSYEDTLKQRLEDYDDEYDVENENFYVGFGVGEDFTLVILYSAEFDNILDARNFCVNVLNNGPQAITDNQWRGAYSSYYHDYEDDSPKFETEEDEINYILSNPCTDEEMAEIERQRNTPWGTPDEREQVLKGLTYAKIYNDELWEDGVEYLIHISDEGFDEALRDNHYVHDVEKAEKSRLKKLKKLEKYRDYI